MFDTGGLDEAAGARMSTVAFERAAGRALDVKNTPYGGRHVRCVDIHIYHQPRDVHYVVVVFFDRSCRKVHRVPMSSINRTHTTTHETLALALQQ